MTLGPATGRLIAEMTTGEQPFMDPTPYRIDRFWHGGGAREESMAGASVTADDDFGLFPAPIA